MQPRIEDDINFIVNKSQSFLSYLNDKTILLTGGTGFFGKWFLEYFKAINLSGISIKVLILTRKPEKFLEEYPQFNFESFEYIRGDIKNFEIINRKIDYIIHAASDLGPEINKNNPESLYSNIISGMNNILKVASHTNAEKLLFTSSGAVYGKIDTNKPFTEDIEIDEDTLTAYGRGKLHAENLAIEFSKKSELEVKVARCFAFLGPYMDRDGSFAITNFLKNSKELNQIDIASDGKSVRSFMYAADLIYWLMKILLNGKKSTIYNVGSDEEVTIKELANMISEIRGGIRVNVKNNQNNGVGSNYYVSSIKRCKEELGLVVETRLHRGLEKMVENGY